jgi:hypothetical protein
MGRLLFKLPWGRVCMKTVKQHDEKGKIVMTEVPYFKGDPDKYVKALAEKNPNLTDQFMIVTNCLQGSATPDPFWQHCQAIISKKMKQKAELEAGKAL